MGNQPIAERPPRVVPFIQALPGVALGMLLSFGRGTREFGRTEAIGLAIGLLVVLASLLLRRLPAATQRNLAVSTAVTFATCLVFEVLFSTFAWRAGLGENSCWLFENSDRTFRFDPIRGYRLTQTPSRFARITRGQTEYVGAYRGNAQGFQDRDDFAPARPPGGVRRVAVFGDSFTTAAFLQTNWPDRAEDIARRDRRSVELMNFAVDGAGLANWWSVFRGVVRAEAYELDAVVFAVFYDDLWRSFSFAEHRGYRHHMFNRVSSWDPSAFPKTDAEARAALYSSGAPIVDRAAMDRALSSRACPRTDARQPFRFVVASRVSALFRRLVEPPTRTGAHAAPLPPESPERRALVRDIDSFVRERGVPAYVVFVPTLGHLTDPAEYRRDPVADDIRAFATAIHAEFWDGREAFAGMSPDAARACFFKYDGHWNQTGSDRFAAYMARRLSRE